MPDRHTIEHAATRLYGHVRRTPTLMLEADALPAPGVMAVAGAGAGAVALKLEFLQHSGSFKARGAFNRLLGSPIPAAGVVAASGGNHGAAVAYAAQRLGHPATIFVPGPTPAAKVARIRSYGAEIVQGGAAYADAWEACQAHQVLSGALNVHAYDDPDVVSGQGSVGLELLADKPDLTHVLVSVGGGGLMAGIAAALEGSGARVVAVEPSLCPTLHAALAAGAPVPVAVSGLAADSLGARTIGRIGFEVARRTGVSSVLVEDIAIRAAQLWLWERLRIVSEPGGAAALAALLSGAWRAPAGSKVAVVLCGANADPGLAGGSL